MSSAIAKTIINHYIMSYTTEKESAWESQAKKCQTLHLHIFDNNSVTYNHIYSCDSSIPSRKNYQSYTMNIIEYNGYF